MHTYYNSKASNLVGSVWGGDLKGFTILNKSYTVVFTLTASGAYEEIGFFPDDWSGFVLALGQDAYRFVITTKKGTAVSMVRIEQSLESRRQTYNRLRAL
ncbi:MAG: hypothetical protein E7677_05425 [Ruminococcaceae bacterium]|nr:hypothetical protein [Oscillospiraceae bacterium]